MQYTETYRCNLCNTEWKHLWDTEDYNNDFTTCPNCFEFDFEEIEDTVDTQIKLVFTPYLAKGLTSGKY